MKHHCGLFGVFGHPNAVKLTYLGLYAQQHRGQESAGICSCDHGPIRRHAKMGLVTEVFDPPALEALANPIAIGHVRYSTTGSCQASNAQPLLVNYALGQVAVAHNGNLINAALLRDQYEQHGAIFNTTSDTEVIVHLLAKPSHLDKVDRLVHVLGHLQGAYSLLFMFPDAIVAARDPFGFRPLVLGRMEDGTGAMVVATETSALDIIDATLVREVMPGEVVVISDKGMTSQWVVPQGTVKPSYCTFEQVYFADPSSDVFGENVHEVRRAMGMKLAEEAPVEADKVIPVPNCARCAAIGYARASGIMYGRGFTVSHYAGRSFILPDQNMRDLAVKMKLNVIKPNVKGKRLVVVEDSVVRGTTTRGKIGALRNAGAKEVHLRVASPPIRHACYFGIDFPDPAKLIANNRTVEEIRDYLGVDSLHYLSLEGMLSCVKHPPEHYCTACWSGEYPMPVDHPVSKLVFEDRQLKMFD